MTDLVFLPPGTVCCRDQPTVLVTILGSCVAVCLWDRIRRVGGMNHFLLPRCGSAPRSARYGDVAFIRLLARMEQLGCRAADLRAKVFGGAAVLPIGAHRDTVGTQNVTLALEILRLHGIPVIARRTGGKRGLYLRLHTGTGRVMVRELADAANAEPGRHGPLRQTKASCTVLCLAQDAMR